MLLSDIKNASTLIYKLLANGYHNHDLAILLRHLDILDPIDEVCKLLSGKDSNLRTERCMIICDELSMPCIQSRMIHKNTMLEKVFDYDIINCLDVDVLRRRSDLYGRGYKIFGGSTYIHVCDVAASYNAYCNGLYASSAIIINDRNCDRAQFSDMFMEFESIFIPEYNYLQLENVLSLFKNVKHVTIAKRGSEKSSNINKILANAKIMHNLKEISTLYHFLDDNSLRFCESLEILQASNNCNITTCAPFSKTLRKLDATGACGINDVGISSCTRLKTLSVSGNRKISTCAPFAKTLKILHATYPCGITNASLLLCNRLKTLSVRDNRGITSCVPFAKSLRNLYYTERYIHDDQIMLCKKLKHYCKY